MLNPTPKLRRTLGALAFAITGLLAVSSGNALAAYPDKVIKMIVPFPPGGATDVIGRILAAHLSAALGQQVVIDNKGGAGGNIGAEAVAKAPADGYTLLMGALTSHSTIATLEKGKLRYDLLRELSAVAIVGQVPLVFVTHPSVPARSLKEFVTYMKANPGKVSFASSGAGAPQRLASEMIKTQNHLFMVHIPYRGSGPAITDLIGGQVQFMAETVPAVLQHIRAGKLNALAVTSTIRVPNLPDVPTTAQAGFPGVEVSSTFGVLLPSGTPKYIVERLNTEIYKIMQRPEVQAQMAQQGVLALAPLTPEQAQERVRTEVAKWATVIAESGIKAEE